MVSVRVKYTMLGKIAQYKECYASIYLKFCYFCCLKESGVGSGSDQTTASERQVTTLAMLYIGVDYSFTTALFRFSRCYKIDIVSKYFKLLRRV